MTDLTLLSDAGETSLPNTLRVETGRYVADPGTAVAYRFQAGGSPVNAARVTVRTLGTTFFAGNLLPNPAIGTTALASASNEAAFSIGSRLASLKGGIINQLLGKLLGTDLSLSVMDYNALLGADVNLLGFLDALAGKASITAGTYDDVLNSDVTVGRFVSAHLSALGTVAGILIVVMGLHFLGVFRIPLLYRSATLQLQLQRKPAGLAGAFVMGLAFAFGWTPCAGPILAAVLLMAGSEDTAGRGALLLLAYSLPL